MNRNNIVYKYWYDDHFILWYNINAVVNLDKNKYGPVDDHYYNFSVGTIEIIILLLSALGAILK